MDDLISRQDAIEVLRNRWLKTRNYDGIGEDIAEECEIYLKTLPSTQPESCDGCQWEYAFGYGECHHCKRNFNDMYERGEQDAEIR